MKEAFPTSIGAALTLLSGRRGALLRAGGESLMPMVEQGLIRPELVIDLRNVPDLGRIDISADAIRFGAKVTWSDLERLGPAQPLLAAAAAQVGTARVRERGTIGGSLAHADPAAELLGIALACDGVVTLVAPKGTRTMMIADFVIGPHYTARRGDEMIVGLRLPAWPGPRRWGFARTPRGPGDFALAAVAAFFDQDLDGRIAGARIGVNGIGDRPMRLVAVETALEGREPDDAATLRAALDAMPAPAGGLVTALLEQALTACGCGK